MKIIARAGREDIAVVYIAQTEGGKLIEFVESVQPPIPRQKKWVLIISSLYGCPVGCRFCDAGGYYQGRLSLEELISQIDYLVRGRFPEGGVPVEKFKIQFARMGEPSFNPNVLDLLDRLPDLFHCPGLLPSFSTMAPEGTDRFFKELLKIKKKHYARKFQFQFSLHTTDQNLRDWFVPVKKWSFQKMSEFGKAFYESGDRKITLNFALADGTPVDPDVLLRYFTPETFLIKITPVNPTYQATKNKIFSTLAYQKENETIEALRAAGYEVILSIGELEENHIGSNCGQFVTAYKNQSQAIEGGYTYDLQRL